MSEQFLRFKKRLMAFIIIRSVIIALSVGLTLGGLSLMLIRLALIELAPLTPIFIGLGSAALTGAVVFLLSRRSDKSLAIELDGLFGLDERVQTMIEYSTESGEMVLLQRRDTEDVLSSILLKSYRFKGLWIYILSILLSEIGRAHV